MRLGEDGKSAIAPSGYDLAAVVPPTPHYAASVNDFTTETCATRWFLREERIIATALVCAAAMPSTEGAG